MLAQIIGGVIVVMVGLSLFPIIEETMQIESNVSNPAMEQMVGYTPMLFLIGIFILAGVMILNALRNNDSIDEDVEELNEEFKVKEVKPHKQTYLEYVKERLAAENLLKWRI